MSRNLTSVLFGLIGAAALSMVAVAAGPDLGPVQMQSLNWAAIGIFALFVLGTLGITYRAAMQTKTAADFYAAGGGITAFQNGLAIAGDYMSAASFLGIFINQSVDHSPGAKRSGRESPRERRYSHRRGLKRAHIRTN